MAEGVGFELSGDFLERSVSHAKASRSSKKTRCRVSGRPFLNQVRSIVAVLARRFRSQAVVELENLALRHQLQFFVANGRVGPD